MSPYFFNANANLPDNTKYTMKQIGRVLQTLVSGSEIKQEGWPEFNVDLIVVHSLKLRAFICNLGNVDNEKEATINYVENISEDDAIDSFEAFVKFCRGVVPADAFPEELKEQIKEKSV